MDTNNKENIEPKVKKYRYPKTKNKKTNTKNQKDLKEKEETRKETGNVFKRTK